MCSKAGVANLANQRGETAAVVYIRPLPAGSKVSISFSLLPAGDSSPSAQVGIGYTVGG